MIFDILVFLFVLGLLVFFHELGHFIAAKACGVYCDRFSLGMPPRVWGIRLGETDYCIGALPIGGYVKMAGQEDAPKTEEERQEEYGHVPPSRWFNNKPVWQRAIIVFAGPLMNLVLAVLLYAVVAGFGAKVPESEVSNRIGLVLEEYPAATAPMYALPEGQDTLEPSGAPDAIGWKTGDRIESVNGERVRNIQDVAISAVLSTGDPADVVVVRDMPGGLEQRYFSRVAPAVLKGDTHPRFGVAPFQTALVGDTVFDLPAREAGLQKKDVIVSAHGAGVDAQTFTQIVSANTEGEPVSVTVQRGDAQFDVMLHPKRVGRIQDVAFSPPVDALLNLPESKEIPVAVKSATFYRPVSARSAAFWERSGFKAGDTIVGVEGQEPSPELLRDLEKTRQGEQVAVTVRRGGGLWGLVGQPTQVDLTVDWDDLMFAVTGVDDQQQPKVAASTPEFREKYRLRKGDVITAIKGQPATLALLREVEENSIGESIAVSVHRPAVLFGLKGKASDFETAIPVTAIGVVGVIWDPNLVFHREPLRNVAPEALRQTYLAFDRTVKTITMLVTGHASPKELGGPVMIYQITTQAARAGYSWLLLITAFISVNLCVFNLLPLPVLDGGLLLVLGVESIRRKPVDARVLERIQQVGLVFIILLILFVTYNDLMRSLTGGAF